MNGTGPGTKQVGLPINADASSTTGCYIPPPKTCTFTFPSKEVRLSITPAEPISDSQEYQSLKTIPQSILETPHASGILQGIRATYTSSNTSAPLAVLDGDCRLSVPGADNALTEAAGNATFDAIGWMATPKYAKSMGHNVTATRVRWVRSCCWL